MNERIKKAVEELGIAHKKVFTLGELEQIAKMAGCTLRSVMRYLRNR